MKLNTSQISVIVNFHVNQCTNEYLFWSESNIEYYSPQPNCPNQIANIICAVKYIRIIQNIRILEYFQIICKCKDEKFSEITYKVLLCKDAL